MKKFSLFVSLVCALVFTSCNIVYEVTFNENGSGTVQHTFDFSQLAMNDFSNKDEKNIEKKDTTFVFKDIMEVYRDSLKSLSKEEQEIYKMYEKISGKMVIDSENGVYQTSLTYDFDNLKELQKFNQPVYNKVSEQTRIKQFVPNEQGVELTQEITNFNTSYEMLFSKKKFSMRLKSEIAQQISKMNSQESHENLEEDNENFLKLMGEFLTIKLQYNFPYEIIKINNKRARILPNRRGFELDFKIEHLIENPNCNDLEVIFK